jgi:hypothetical protein
MYVQLTIGRNHCETGNAATLASWHETLERAELALSTFASGLLGADDDAPTVEVHTGMGCWEGKVEESAKVAVHFDVDPEAAKLWLVDDMSTFVLNRNVAAIAKLSHQWAIHLLVIDTEHSIIINELVTSEAVINA